MTIQTTCLTVLGSTGSIGTQTLRVSRNMGCKVVGLSAHRNTVLLEQQAREFHPRCVAIGDESRYTALKTALADTDITVTAGADAVSALAARPDAGLVLNAVVGIAGLAATLAAISVKNRLALANKESLVTAGALVMERARKAGVQILPVDSEHSAIFQCLNGENRDRIKRILLTASGGPFFGRTREQLRTVTAQDALRHPNWNMGPKITIDSATLMNKGLELIEAMHLFDVTPDDITILVHRQSILHSAVEFCDGTVIGQMGSPDMALPIQYAVTWPDRTPGTAKPLSLFDAGTLTFERPCLETFGCLAAAIEAARRGGLVPCAVNGANEAAVGLFLEGEIGFLDIEQMVRQALSLAPETERYTVDDVYAVDRAAREMVYRSAPVSRKGSGSNPL